MKDYIKSQNDYTKELDSLKDKVRKFEDDNRKDNTRFRDLVIMYIKSKLVKTTLCDIHKLIDNTDGLKVIGTNHPAETSTDVLNKSIRQSIISKKYDAEPKYWNDELHVYIEDDIKQVFHRWVRIGDKSDIMKVSIMKDKQPNSKHIEVVYSYGMVSNAYGYAGKVVQENAYFFTINYDKFNAFAKENEAVELNIRKAPVPFPGM